MLLGFLDLYLVGYKLFSKTGSESYAYPVLSGVPQGSVLGPILFIIYNHVVHDLSCGYKIFAANLKLYLHVNHHHIS